MENVTSMFGLDAEQTLLLYSLEYRIIQDDVTATLQKNREKGNRKKEWLNRWTVAMNNSLQSMGIDRKIIPTNDSDTFSNNQAVSTLKSLIESIAQKHGQNAWRYMILLECTLFVPYYPLSKEDEKNVKGLKPSKNSLKNSVEYISDLLGTDKKYINIFEKEYKSALKRLNPLPIWMTILVPIAIIILILAAIVTFQYELAALFVPGLYGVAAVNAALAMLGGGAIAAGGLGMAAGVMIVIGGGAFVGTGLGVGVLYLMGMSSKFTLSQLARLEVVMKEIILGMQHDVEAIQKILRKMADNQNELKKEIIRLKADAKKNKERIKNLEESIKYMENFINAKR